MSEAAGAVDVTVRAVTVAAGAQNDAAAFPNPATCAQDHDSEGNLTIWWIGRDPQVLRNAEFWPSDKPAKQRKREADEAWAECVRETTAE